MESFVSSPNIREAGVTRVKGGDPSTHRSKGFITKANLINQGRWDRWLAGKDRPKMIAHNLEV
ncbi:unnamed protein product [Clonostachys rosea f. rosea IK726]|uniref:Uncharacterized protein n=1 Tax=Clonostachys rosea f. rosea IK726 TaxID=1349383 RepID=A0ACA9THV3_BIOOC|nr:unnamed protein product [Clonostachys rosea f. rosea IK726]